MTELRAPQRADRPPRTALEHIVANCRPQPAIPAVLSCLLLVLLPAMSVLPQPGVYSAWMAWLIPLGTVVSCGLAVAAGFCSLAPQFFWIVLAGWGLSLVERAQLPEIHRIVLLLGITAALLMVGVQLWRIVTHRFVPTLTEPD